MARDPKLCAQSYLEKHQLNEIMEGLLSELLVLKPASPRQWLCGQLEKIKVAGTKPLLDQQDLGAMFGMFDVTKRGVVTQQQAGNALRTVLGHRAPQQPADAAGVAMCQQEFVSYMHTALQDATPLCKGRDGQLRSTHSITD